MDMGKNKYYCKINGKVENLEDIQNLIDENELTGKITLTMYEKYGWDIQDAILFEEVIKFNNNEIPADYNECLERMRNHNARSVEIATANKPKCPTCGSYSISKITVTKKATKTFLFGIFGAMDDAGKTWKCNKCGSKW